jgi:hypothetical protein
MNIAEIKAESQQEYIKLRGHSTQKIDWVSYEMGYIAGATRTIEPVKEVKPEPKKEPVKPSVKQPLKKVTKKK